MNIHAIILAAGKGTRMNSDIPKVLHKVKDIALIDRVLEKVMEICAIPTVVVGYKAEDVIAHTKNKYHYVFQKEQLGTGHAVFSAKDALFDKKFDAMIVLPGDHPSVQSSTIRQLALSHLENGAKLSITTVMVPDFSGDFSEFYNCGRIMRDENGDVSGIIELRDANKEQQNIKEVNVSYYCFNPDWLWQNIGKLINNNNANEYYLTDLIKMAAEKGEKINSITINNPIEGMGVNTCEQLEIVERYIF